MNYGITLLKKDAKMNKYALVDYGQDNGYEIRFQVYNGKWIGIGLTKNEYEILLENLKHLKCQDTSKPSGNKWEAAQPEESSD